MAAKSTFSFASFSFASSVNFPTMQRFEEDDSDGQLRAVLKADEFAKFQAKRAAQKRGRRLGKRPNY